jgi:hypothetical protein
MPKELEKYLRDICEAHGFDNASITHHAPHIRHSGFNASVQWNFGEPDHQCASASGASIEEAFSYAIKEASERRDSPEQET